MTSLPVQIKYDECTGPKPFPTLTESAPRLVALYSLFPQRATNQQN